MRVIYSFDAIVYTFPLARIPVGIYESHYQITAVSLRLCFKGVCNMMLGTAFCSAAVRH